jgi:hypothetical protein
VDSLGVINAAPIVVDHRDGSSQGDEGGPAHVRFAYEMHVIRDACTIGSAISRDACCKEMDFQTPLIREWKIPKAT